MAPSTCFAIVLRVSAVLRRNTMRVVATATAAVMSATVVGCSSAGPKPRPAPSPNTCAIQHLPLAAGMSNVFVTDADPTGRYLVGQAQVNGHEANVLWDADNVTVLDPPFDGFGATAVNSAGDVAISGYQLGTPGGWLLHNATYSPLNFATLLGGQAANAAKSLRIVDINSRGDVLGEVVSADGSTVVDAVWHAGQAAPQMLTPPLTPGTVVLVGLAEDGTAVAYLEPPDGTSQRNKYRAFAWSVDGRSTRDLPTLPEVGPGTVAHAVRGDWVIGSVLAADESRDPISVRWNLRTASVEELPRNIVGLAVTANGWVAGYSTLGRDGYPLLWRQDQTLRLELPASEHWTLALLTAVSDDGEAIAGRVEFPDLPDQDFAARWVCK